MLKTPPNKGTYYPPKCMLDGQRKYLVGVTEWHDHEHDAQEAHRLQARVEELEAVQPSALKAKLESAEARLKELENEQVEHGAILEAIMGALKGEEPSDFMRSFPDVEHAWWIYRLAYPTAK